jgi:predicted Rossmann fold nucleotide-binding protein DprA/Smf involved in DNA uptake
MPADATPVPQKRGGDDSARVLEKLSEKQRRVFDEMPLDRAITVDYLTKTGFTLGEVISALTVLEIKGLVASLPGALYIRR